MDEDEEMTDIYGPQWEYGNGADSEGLKKMMWLEVGKEFNCKAILPRRAVTIGGRKFLHTMHR